ncbi:MAG: fatty acid--CoA ligase family protein [Phycisphaerales bacterium]
MRAAPGPRLSTGAPAGAIAAACASPGDWLGALERRACAAPRSVAISEVGPSGRVTASVTAEQLAAHCAARAREMSGSLHAGAAVLLALPSGIDLAAWMVGALAAGLRAVLMHPRCTGAEIARAAGIAGASVVIRDGAGAGAAGLSTRLAKRAPGSVILSSSGTTGLPRLAEREAPALNADAAAVAEGLRLTPDDVVLCIPPLCHSYGVDLLLGALASGAELRVMGEYDGAGAAAQLGAGVTVLPGIPFVFESLLRMGPAGAARPRLAVSAGAPLADAVREGFRERWGVDVGQLYGATELGTVAVHRPDEPDFDPGSVGRPVGGASFLLVEVEDGGPPGRGVGELAVRAPSMLSRYLDGDVPLRDGHFLTGDLARVDSSGRAWVCGRRKLLIDVGGFKVNPLEVEAALREHPGVADCAVAPIALSETVRRVRAFIVPVDPAGPPKERELRAFLRERLSAVKVPRVFECVAALPRSPTGKLLRSRLPGAAC